LILSRFEAFRNTVPIHAAISRDPFSILPPISRSEYIRVYCETDPHDVHPGDHSMAFRRLTQQSCAACVFWLVMAAGAALVLLLVISRLALGAAVATVQGMFAFIWAAATGLIQGLGTLSVAAAWGLGAFALVFAGWLWLQRSRAHRWRRIETVRDEFEPLLTLLRRKGMKTYRQRIEAMRDRLFIERDRVEELDELLGDELPRIEDRFRELSKQYHRSGPGSDRDEIWALMESLTANSAALRGRRGTIEKFETGKIQLATKLNCLRLKLSGLEQNESEIGSLLRTIDDISFVANVIDRPSDAGITDPIVPPPIRRPVPSATDEEPPQPPSPPRSQEGPHSA